MQIAIASDHAAFDMKAELTAWLRKGGHDVTDLGPDSTASVDYPDFGARLARCIGEGAAQRGIALCGSGIGISIAVNRHPAVRCALVAEPLAATLAREHNDANCIALGARLIGIDMAKACVTAFLTTDFVGRQRTRWPPPPPGGKTIRPSRSKGNFMTAALKADNANEGSERMPADRFWHDDLATADPAIAAAIADELHRQQDKIELIASENIASRAVLEATGSVFTNKYAEGYPGKRYYGGCDYADVVETLAIDRAKELFGCNFANVQPNSGSQMNQAVFLALLEPGDIFMGLDLNSGGHLTHGSPVNMSGKWFNPVAYGVRQEDELIDMDQVAATAREHRPKLIICGGTAYSAKLGLRPFPGHCGRGRRLSALRYEPYIRSGCGRRACIALPARAHRDQHHAQIFAWPTFRHYPVERRGA